MLMDPMTSSRMVSQAPLSEEPERWLRINRTDHPDEELIDYFRVGIDTDRGEAYFVIGSWLNL